MKRLIALALACLMVFACTFALAEKSELQKAYDEEMRLARYITSRGAAYELDTLVPYQHYWFQVAWTFDKMGKPIEEAANGIYNKYGELLPNAGSGEQVIDTLKTLREQLVQVVDDPESVCWYLWDDNTSANMPQEDGVENLNFEHTFDEPGFVPFLVPYMLEDQSAVKGNAIMIAGGGFNQRCHDYEGDISAVVLNDLGYNVFILQRRVLPFAEIDCSIDLQRAVRYIKYYAEEKGIGAIDHIFTIGYSGGGMTILNQLKSFYGDITPDATYPTYVCDAIDAINADYEATGIFYGATSGYTSENPNMPDMFITVGAKDTLILNSALDLFNVANANDWNPELYIVADAPHGFALTGVRAFTDQGTTAAKQAVSLFDTYLDIAFGYQPAHF